VLEVVAKGLQLVGLRGAASEVLHRGAASVVISMRSSPY